MHGSRIFTWDFIVFYWRKQSIVFLVAFHLPGVVNHQKDEMAAKSSSVCATSGVTAFGLYVRNESPKHKFWNSPTSSEILPQVLNSFFIVFRDIA